MIERSVRGEGKRRDSLHARQCDKTVITRKRSEGMDGRLTVCLFSFFQVNENSTTQKLLKIY